MRVQWLFMFLLAFDGCVTDCRYISQFIGKYNVQNESEEMTSKDLFMLLLQKQSLMELRKPSQAQLTFRYG